MASQATSVLFEERIEVPLTIHTLDDFRRWALSDEFPETGRIDFIDGNIEVTTSPEEGSTDLVVEIVNDNSATKDTQRLPVAYFRAGVREFWLANARGKEPIFIIHRPGAKSFEPVAANADGFQPSTVLGRRYRLDSMRDSKGNWEFDLREEA